MHSIAVGRFGHTECQTKDVLNEHTVGQTL